MARGGIVPAMSESEKYRAIGAGATFIFVLVALLGIGVIVAVVSLLPKDINGGAAFGVMIGMSLPTIAALFLLTRGMDRRHARRVGRRLAPDGFTLIDAPTLEQQTTVSDDVVRMLMLPAAPVYVSWIARKPTPKGDVVVVRHAHVVGSGKGTREIVQMIASVPLTRQAPGVWLTHTGWLQRRDDARHDVQDIQLGEPAWDDAYRIQAHDPAAPARLLALPGVREHIGAGPSRESWAITGTHAICTFSADTTPDGVATMTRRATRMAELVGAGF